MSRRDLIRMTADEQAEFLATQRVITVASIGPGGRPHLMPLWFVPDGDGLLAWTYGSSQKIKNLERLPEATVLSEAGDEYQELRGVQMECDVELITDTAAVTEIGLAVALRYAPGELTPDTAPRELREMITGQAAKRVGMRFAPTKTVTWDHRKLGGTY